MSSLSLSLSLSLRLSTGEKKMEQFSQMTSIKLSRSKSSGEINWLYINDRFEQCISSLTFKYFNYLTRLYMNDVFKLAGQNTTSTSTSLFKLSQPLRETNHGQKCLSYVAPSIWNKLSEFLKTQS